ncbi:MAG: hypothetical protein HC836_35815 [Richelia sp. RM2_1_2]|nr:hypothetical protein [Richelia sp. SM2_1_7]NJM19586.1 hypothetical protein [Richelia sp. SM1_7_0]NJN12389.1 hypothetical protein [Richelia sp. RM1_1_1]NJO30667.1 hypothetical protein [Richelia sp. SL_2_1]NJO63390.1 hypothetical protein [Richelia sp. RM2_1_2]
MYEGAIQANTLREAWEQGLQQGLIQVAVNMLDEGIDLTLVAKVTGLSVEKIHSLHNNTDDTQTVVEDFLELSESSLSKIWLTPEEDEAWKEL